MPKDVTKPKKCTTDGEAMFESLRVIVDTTDLVELSEIFDDYLYPALSGKTKQLLSLVALEFRRRMPR